MGLDETFNVQAVIDRACTSKHPFSTPGEARSAAKLASARTGEAIRSYRCPFGDGCWKHAHWHCGRVPNLESLQNIARAIRECHEARRVAS